MRIANGLFIGIIRSLFNIHTLQCQLEMFIILNCNFLVKNVHYNFYFPNQSSKQTNTFFKKLRKSSKNIFFNHFEISTKGMDQMKKIPNIKTSIVYQQTSCLEKAFYMFHHETIHIISSISEYIVKCNVFNLQSKDVLGVVKFK